MSEAEPFPRPLTPGAYLKARRCAAGVTVQDVARELQTLPRWAEQARTEWIERIEADIEEPMWSTIIALRSVYPFDLDILEALAWIHLGAKAAPPVLCGICAADLGLSVQRPARCFAHRTMTAAAA